jgi:TonB family protein
MIPREARFVFLAATVGAIALSAQNTGVIRSSPLPSPQDAADLESHVLQNPDDVRARISLLQYYLNSAALTPNANSSRSSIRLQHILYLVEHHPELPASASRAAYVYRANGPYADAADHDAVRDQWLAAVQAHPNNNAVAMNAVKFLEAEDKDDAEQVLRRGLDTEPGNRELAVNLGFLYTMEILHVDSMTRGALASKGSPDLAAHAISELQESSNATVVAAAGTALPNMVIAANARGGLDEQKIFDLASNLSARARQLAPDDPEIQTLMPLLKYFVAAQEGSSGKQTETPPSRIKVGGNVQAANLMRSTPPQYPEVARAAGITGDVRFTVVIGRDGAIQDVQLISGHPLLVDAARTAVETWIYRPTLLNGSPVEVATTISVSFPPN